MVSEAFIIDKQPLAGGKFSTWLFLLAENGFRISLKYVPRAIYITLLSAITAPFRIIEEKKYKAKIMKQEPQPIFIIGHFRSGTTYLHYLMSHDANMSYVSTFETMVPSNFLFFSQFFKKLLSSSLPETRPMDSVRMAPDYPYEEEYGVANLSPYSFYHGWYFPKKMREYFDKYVLFKDKKIAEKWKQVYSYLLKKVVYKEGKERILLKNPPNTARIKELIDLYPDAKFIHIYRNPYEVFFSTKKLYEGIMPLFALQNYDMEEIEENIFYFYKAMYEKFFKEQHLIKEENYIEIKYENFIKSPLKTLEEIYRTLDMPGFEDSKNRFKNYIARQKNYKPRNYKISKEYKERIYEHWKVTIDKWGY
ncbi:MAG: sulfotransferase [Thermoplasmata archaeon]|nr:sulfotransferase [Thermoplasmata archaeon]